MALVERHVAAPAVLTGHSLGALVAALVAAQLPGNVRALILEDPPGSTLADGLAQSRFHLQFTNTERLLSERKDLGALTAELALMPVQRPIDGALVPFSEVRDLEAIQFGAECLLQMDPAVLKTLVQGRWLDGLDWFAALPKIACPTLVLRADPAQGGMLKEAEASRITSLIPHCTRVDLPGVAHSIHSSEPKQMLALVTDFLEYHQLLSARTQP
jgi:pimeloyl-ACP methyl ester carboxylesterase